MEKEVQLANKAGVNLAESDISVAHRLPGNRNRNGKAGDR